MLILKRTLLFIVAPLLSTLLLLTALDYGIVRIVGTPAPIKKTLADSGVYDSVVGSLLSQAKTSTGSSGEVSLTDPLVQKAASQTFTPQYLKTQTESFLDSTYQWLNGVTPSPDFKLDVTSLKTSLADNVASGVKERLTGLPVCATGFNPASFDPLTATCLPKGITPTSAANDVRSTLTSGQGFLDDPNISANDIKQDGSSQSVFADQLKQVPDAFALVKKSPYILAGLAILAATAVIFLSSTKQKGLRRVGVSLITVGVIVLIFAWGTNYLVTKKALPEIKFSDNLVMQEKLKTLAKDVTQQIVATFWVFGGVYTVLGVSAVAGPSLMNRRSRAPKTAPAAEPIAEKPTASASHPETKPDEPEQPKKRNIKIQ